MANQNSYNDTCPICGLKGVSPEKDKCPQCDADLSCFRVLNSIPEEIPQEKNKFRIQLNKFSLIILIIIPVFIMTVIIIVFQTYFLSQFKTAIKKNQLDSEKLIKRMILKSNSLNHDKPESGEPNLFDNQIKHEQAIAMHFKKENFLFYSIKKGDTLASISKIFYHSAYYYPVLLEHNPLLEIYNLPKYKRIKILKNKKLVKKIYSQICTQQDSHIYLYYTVKPGDTIISIANKFYRSKKMVYKILEHNPSIQIKPGEKLKILLE